MWPLVKTHKMKTKKESLLGLREDLSTWSVSLGLTRAGLLALKPPVTNVVVVGASAILIPSTAKSATTGSA